MPFKVENVEVGKVGPTTITVGWDEPHDMGSAIAGYNIQESCREEDWWNEKMDKKEKGKMTG